MVYWTNLVVYIFLYQYSLLNDGISLLHCLLDVFLKEESKPQPFFVLFWINEW
jgi:hypothetical protein